jgi:hypothetical protein
VPVFEQKHRHFCGIDRANPGDLRADLSVFSRDTLEAGQIFPVRKVSFFPSAAVA